MEIAIAADTTNWEGFEEILQKGQNLVQIVKIGPATLLSLGLRALQKAKEQGYEIFLDLKLHDIPYQVGKAVAQAETLGVRYVTVHASGGREMVRAAVERGAGLRVLIVGALTSLSEESVMAIYGRNRVEQLLWTAQVAGETGAWGIVTPGDYLPVLKRHFEGLNYVVPGLRWRNHPSHDHDAPSDPHWVHEQGGGMLVFGRAVTASREGWSRLEEFVRWARTRRN